MSVGEVGNPILDGQLHYPSPVDIDRPLNEDGTVGKPVKDIRRGETRHNLKGRNQLGLNYSNTSKYT